MNFSYIEVNGKLVETYGTPTSPRIFVGSSTDGFPQWNGDLNFRRWNLRGGEQPVSMRMRDHKVPVTTTA